MFRLLLKKNKYLGFLSIFFLVCYSAYSPILSKLIQYNMSVAEGKYALDLLRLTTINLSVLILLCLVNWFSQYFSIKFYSRSQNELNQLFYSKAAKHVTEELKVSKLIKIFSNDIPLIVDNYIPSLISLIYFGLSFSFGAILIFSLNKIILCYLILIAVCSLLVSKKMSNKISPSQKKYNDSLGNNSDVLLDIFDHSIIRKVFFLDNFLEKRFASSSEQSAKKMFVLKKEKSIVTVSNDSFAWLLQIGMYVIGAILITQKSLSFAELIAITQAAGTITTPIFWFSNTLADIYSSKEIRQEMMEFLQSEDSQKREDFHSVIDKVEMKNVTFLMENKREVGPNSFILEKGNSYAMIGKNGSGKSTIYAALMLANNKYRGEILINGKNIQNLKKEGYLSQISAVTQNIKLYNGSVIDNITGFSSDVNEEKLRKIKKLFINEQDEFFSKEISSLSGGQKQMVSIARALYKDASFLIMDEPFSALDKVMEEVVLDYLLKIDDKIVLLSLHHYDQLVLDRFNDVVIIGERL